MITKITESLSFKGLLALGIFFLAMSLTAGESGGFIYTDNGADITITGYNGAGGDVTIPDSIYGKPVTSIGGYLDLHQAYHGAFEDEDSLTSVTLPNSVTSIGNSAFYSCSYLTRVTIGSGVTSIGEYAFYYCSNLTSITIPNSVTSIGGRAFSYCGLTSIVIPNSVISIGDFAFCPCSSLTNVTIGSGVTSIGEYAFSAFNDNYYSNLLTITVSPDNLNYSSEDGVLFDKSKTVLILCPARKSGAYTIPSSVTSIGRAFYLCSSLTSVIIPNSVTSIENSAFYSCLSLTSVTIGSVVTSNWI